MNNLNDTNLIKKIDKDDMAKLLIKFPLQLIEGGKIGLDFEIPKRYRGIKYKNIVFVGMGGSAIGADLIKSYLEGEIKIPIYVNRDYRLPAFVDEDTLLFTCSYSGNTEETLSCFEIARKKKAKIIILSSGGKVERLSKKYKIPLIKIPRSLPPRCALGYSFTPPLIVLNKLGLIKDKQDDIREVYNLILKKVSQFKPSAKIKNNRAKELALIFYDKFSVIYGSSSSTEVVAVRLRGQLAENSKTLSSSHLLPEMNHNEIVGWEHPQDILKRLLVVFLEDKDDHVRVKKRIKISKNIIRKSGVKVIEMKSEGRGRLSRLFNLIYLCDWLSFYLAILNDINPTPVERITYLKKELASNKS